MSEEMKKALDELKELPPNAFNHIAEIIHVAKVTNEAAKDEPCEKK